MPVRVIGMIGVAPPAGTALHVIGGGVSASFLGEFAQMHEKAGFDLVLVGYYSSSAEGFAVAAYAASQTTTLGYLVAHRPGLVAPTLAARTIATFDALWREAGVVRLRHPRSASVDRSRSADRDGEILLASTAD